MATSKSGVASGVSIKAHDGVDHGLLARLNDDGSALAEKVAESVADMNYECESGINSQGELVRTFRDGRVDILDKNPTPFNPADLDKRVVGAVHWS
jgi:hypothetical protein